MKKRSTCRLGFAVAVATTVAAMRGTATAQNTAMTFTGATDNNLLNTANYSPVGTPGAATDLEFATGFPSSANLSAGMTSSLSVGSINDLNTSYTVTMLNNSSTGVTLNLGLTGNLGNSVSPVSPTDLLYVPVGATLNIAANSSTGLTALNLGSGTLDIAGTASIQGIIAGTSGLTKTGNGTLLLYQADTYTGTAGLVNANISAGTVQIATGTALGSATGDVTLIGAATLYCYDNLIPSYANSFSSGRTFNISSPISTIKIGGTEGWIITGPIVGTGVLNVTAGSGSLEDDYSTSSAQKYGNGPGILSTNISSGTYILAFLLDLPQGICSISSGATFEELNTGGQYSSNTTFNLAGGNDTINVATANTQLKLFGTVSGSGSLIKTGESTLVLENTNTYTGATNLGSGSTFSLDYTSSLSSNALILGGSTGGATFNTLSTSGLFNSSITTIASTTVAAGGNAINIGNFNTSSMYISLGTITRTGATGTLNVSLPTIGSVTTTATAANFSGGQQTIIGGFATVNGNSWAYNNAGTLTGLPTYNTSFGAGSDVDAVASVSTSVSSINSLRFNTASSVTVTLGGTLTVATGGILESANVGGNASLITGGRLTSGNGTDLIVSQFNTVAPLTIGSQVTGSIALTKTGSGTLILNNTSNNYSGGTFINGGTLGVTIDAVLGTLPATPATNISFMGPGATLQADAASVTISANRNISLGAYGGTFDENSNSLTLTGGITGTSFLYITNTTGGSGGLLTLASTATLSSSVPVLLGNAQSGANFNLGGGRSALFNLSSTTLSAGGNQISAGAFTGNFNFSIGAVGRAVGSTVNFIPPTTGNITTTTANASIGQGQQTILGGYATVNGSTWAVSGSAAAAGIISGLTNYDTTSFGNNLDVDVNATDVVNSANAEYINSLRFNTPGSFNVALGSPTSIVNGENNVSLYIATGGILETSAVGANTNYISGGVLASDDKTDLVVIQNNTAAPLVISSTISNWNTSGVNLGFTKAGPGTVVLSGINNYSGNTFVTGGTLQLANPLALPVGTNLSISVLASTVVSTQSTGTYGLNLNTLTNYGLLDLQTNSAVIHTGSTLASVTAQVKQGFNGGAWNGITGITSSTAAADTTHLTAVGAIINDTGANSGASTGTAIYLSLDGATTVDGDILVKDTYYGDANLNGEVDGSDYSLIDNGFLNGLTGWYNGDFNYDGIVNGSDYTLVDNAFNTQGASLAALVASPNAVATSQIGGTSVPEPASIGLLAMGAISLLGRRRAKRS